MKRILISVLALALLLALLPVPQLEASGTNVLILGTASASTL